MFSLLIIVVIIASFTLSSSQPRIAAFFDFIVGLFMLFSKIVPGTATIFDWALMMLLFITAGLLIILSKTNMRTGQRRFV